MEVLRLGGGEVGRWGGCHLGGGGEVVTWGRYGGVEECLFGPPSWTSVPWCWCADVCPLPSWSTPRLQKAYEVCEGYLERRAKAAVMSASRSASRSASASASEWASTSRRQQAKRGHSGGRGTGSAANRDSRQRPTRPSGDGEDDESVLDL